MSEDDAIIKAVANHIGTKALVGYSSPEYRRHVAKAAIRAYLKALEEMGWVVVKAEAGGSGSSRNKPPGADL
ncbi:hypothetical protein ACJ41P_10690 [Azospirillum argentinense]|uniref:Uncharacterized protein n=1 Tax=Azospirillum argentinense TaxID=2970906 RepID=A0ABW8V5K1_9PROT